MWPSVLFSFQCMIFIFTINGNEAVSDNCELYAKAFCGCKDGSRDEALPLKMCQFDDRSCFPCHMVTGGHDTCVKCEELVCPACKASSVGLTTNQTKIPSFENDHYAQKGILREKRTRKGQKWCKIENYLLSGRFTCKAWVHRKECVLRCFPGDKYMNGYMYLYSCDRKENVWHMDFKPCAGAGRGRMNNYEMPLYKIVARPENNFRVFMPVRHIVVHKHDDYDVIERDIHDSIEHDHGIGIPMVNGLPIGKMGSYHRDPQRPEKRYFKRSYKDLSSSMMSSSVHFNYDDDDEDIYAIEKIPLGFLDDNALPTPVSIWMMSNESSFSYAPYEDVRKASFKVKEEEPLTNELGSI